MEDGGAGFGAAAVERRRPLPRGQPTQQRGLGLVGGEIGGKRAGLPVGLWKEGRKGWVQGRVWPGLESESDGWGDDPGAASFLPVLVTGRHFTGVAVVSSPHHLCASIVFIICFL